MDPSPDNPRSSIAWNGISFSLPKEWQPASVEECYILFAEEGTPTLALKWQEESPSVSLEGKRQALKKKGKKLEGFTMDPTKIPDSWLQVLQSLPQDFATVPFMQQGSYCALCLHKERTLSILIQMHLPVKEKTLQEACTTLASLSVADRGEALSLQLFDLACQMPNGCKLTDFSFQPGLFYFEVTCGNDIFRIERRGPANVVLKGQAFRSWIEENLKIPVANIHKDKEHLPKGAKKRYTWYTNKRPAMLDRIALLRRWRSSRLFTMGAAWVEEDANKLLTVIVSSLEEPSPDLLDQICAHVEIT